MSNDSPQTFFTSFATCVRWGIVLFVSLLALLWAFDSAKGLIGGKPLSFSAQDSAVLVCGAVALGATIGSLLFVFGWMGRATVSRLGVKAPRYSGFHEFVPWADVFAVASSSLSGWPCSIVFRKSDEPPIYLMAIGKRRTEMADCIRAMAPPDSPLVRYFNEHGI